MTIILIAVAVEIVTGTLTGVLVGMLLLRGGDGPGREHYAGPIDRDVDMRIRDAAAGWASAHGRPEGAGLVAEKLRMLHVLGRRRASRRWR